MKYIRLTVLLLCALLYSACDSRNPNQTGGAASPVTSEDSQPVTSKVGIAFSVSRLDETIGLYTAELDTRKVHSLTPAGVQDSIPTFSPDGTRIAFVRRGEGRPTIFSMRADGSDVQQLGKGDSLQRRPLWSPSGKWIAFLEDETLALLDPTVAKGASQPLMEFVGPCFSWSSDSKRLLVTAHIKDTSQMSLGRDFGVFLVDVSSKQPPKLLGELYPEALNNYGHCPILSPDGTQAIITEPQGYSAEIVSIADEPVTRRTLPGRCHSFAPDSKRIAAINVSRSIMLIDRTTLEGHELINWQGASALAANADPCPAWSPDGKQIAFICSPESTQYNDELYIVNVVDGVQRQISDTEEVVFDFSWSLDGKWLNYKMGGDAQTSGFFVVPVSDGDAFKLTEGLTGLGMMVWAPSKKKLKLHEEVPSQAETAVSGAISGKVTRGSPDFSALVENTNPDIIFKDEEGSRADRMMTVGLQERLDVLAQKVKIEWPDNKLRITEAWDEDDEHEVPSLHYEGRAADITVDDQNREKLGRLGQLAVDAGFDWVWYEDESHVHVSVVPD